MTPDPAPTYEGQNSIADSTKAIATSQVALPRATCEQVYAQDGYQASVANLAKVSLSTDNVFRDDGGVRQLGAVTGDVESGYTVSLAVAVDTSTTPSGGRAPSRPPGA